MEQRHPAHTAARPGLTVPPHDVVELYPRAGVLTAWFNAWRAGAVDGLADCPQVRPDDPFHGSDTGLPGWEPARLPLGAALSLLPSSARAFCALPVPGDPAGLPTPVTPRAADAGQAVLIGVVEGTVVIAPTVAADARTVWQASLIAPMRPASGDLRSERLIIMERLGQAIAAIEAITLRAIDGGATAARVATLAAVPMPPGSTHAAVELARRSASLLAIVSGALANCEAGSRDFDRLTQELVPVGRAGRHALAVAFSQASDRTPH